LFVFEVKKKMFEFRINWIDYFISFTIQISNSFYYNNLHFAHILLNYLSLLIDVEKYLKIVLIQLSCKIVSVILYQT